MAALSGRSGCSSEGQHCKLRPSPSCPPVMLFAGWDGWGHCATALESAATGLCASAKKEQGLLGGSSYRAVLGKCCKLHTTCLHLFVLSGINRALQMVMKSFVTCSYEDKIGPTAGGAKYCPGPAEALERARHPLGRSAGSSRLGSLESPWCGWSRACLGETSTRY